MLIIFVLIIIRINLVRRVLEALFKKKLSPRNLLSFHHAVFLSPLPPFLPLLPFQPHITCN